MKSVDEIAAIKAQVEEDLLKRPGVTAVDVGYKYVGGERTDEIAIRVHVDQKKKDVPKNQKIPEEIEGVKTDVLERKYVLQPAMKRVEEIELQVDAGTYTPVRGGISIGPCRVVGGFVFVGTLGAIVRDNATNEQMLLSNFHVMCIDNGWHVGDTMAQPGRVDGGTCPAGVIGTLQRASLGGSVDCAVSSLSGRGAQCDIVDIGNVAGTGATTLGMAVRKRGRTTGLTYGTVDSIALTVTIDYEDGLGNVTLTNQIGIAVDTAHSTKIGDHGDSGSVVVDDSRRVVGLYFAGSTDGQHGIANPIADVLSALNVSLCVPIVKRKEIFKEIKFEKLERKELKVEKRELKEAKVEKLERKELKPEFEKFRPDKMIVKEKGEIEKLPALEGDPFWPERPVDPFQPFPPFQPDAPRGEGSPQAGRDCVDLRTFTPTTGPNPLTTGGAQFTVHQFGGAQPPTYTISTWGGITGLNCGFETEIEVLGDPCPFVSITLAQFAQPATIDAFNADGSLAGTKVMTSAQRTPQTFTFSGKVTRLTIKSPSNEVLLLEFCCGTKETLKPEKPEQKDIGKEKEIKNEKPEKEKPEKEKREKEKREKEKPEKLEFEKDISPKVEKDKHEKEAKNEPKELKNEPKEHKFEKVEKEKHEKEAKNEPKENKQEPKELKNEPKEHKLEPKEFKLEPKELKIEAKEISKIEIPEKRQAPKEKGEKELVEGPGGFDPGELEPADPGLFGPGSGFEFSNPFWDQGDDPEHFIGSELRPDLSQGALRQEDDLG